MKPIKIVHLYPAEMNIYGDHGNRLCLQRRLEWRGIQCTVIEIGIGDHIPSDGDIIIGGGGQDASQIFVETDLHRKADMLSRLKEKSVPMLMVCGMYQLFGKEFITSEDKLIKGIGLLPVSTRAGSRRLIGNVIVEYKGSRVVGYENHSGMTYLEKNATPFARIISGEGNNGNDETEGCIDAKIFGTYMHGPLLPKNPIIADELLKLALINRGITEMDQLDDTLEHIAAQKAMSRPR